MKTVQLDKPKEQLDIKIILAVTVIVYTVYAIDCVWLAFATLTYYPLWYYIVKAVPMVCLVSGFFTFLCTEKNQKNKWLILLPFIHWMYSIFNFYGEWNAGEAIETTGILVVLECYAFFSSSLKIKIFNLFYWLIQIVNIIALFTLLCFYMNINLGFENVPFYGENGAIYTKWFIFAIYRGGTTVRLCGIFNEPGALGTVCSLLFAARFHYMKNWEKLLLLATIVFTYSLAGYVIVFIYYAMYLLKKDARNFLLLILFGILFLMIPNFQFENEALNKFVQRFAITESGFAGDTRTNEAFDNVYNDFLNSMQCFIGYGKGYPYPRGNLSYKTLVLQFGLIGFAVWIFVWIKSSMVSAGKNKDGFLFILCFFFSFYQRPRLVETIYGYVLLFGGIEWLVNKEQETIHRKMKEEQNDAYHSRKNIS